MQNLTENVRARFDSRTMAHAATFFNSIVLKCTKGDTLFCEIKVIIKHETGVTAAFFAEPIFRPHINWDKDIPDTF